MTFTWSLEDFRRWFRQQPGDRPLKDGDDICAGCVMARYLSSRLCTPIECGYDEYGPPGNDPAWTAEMPSWAAEIAKRSTGTGRKTYSWLAPFIEALTEQEPANESR